MNWQRNPASVTLPLAISSRGNISIFRNFISLLRYIGMEGRVLELLPELPVLLMVLMEINELVLKRVREKTR